MEIAIQKSPGMGAVLNEGVTTFRVWAPNADKVFVTGTFNDWNDESLEMQLEENGYWATTTDNANEGDEYKFIIHNGEQVLHRNDPYAFELTNSNGNSIIKTLDFDWSFPVCVTQGSNRDIKRLP